MDIVNYFSDNHAQLLFIIAGLSFVVELTVMGLSGPLLFFAIACFLTAMMSSVGIVSGWEAELFSIGVLTTLITALLWKPLKAFQNKAEGVDNSSDMIGRIVPCAIDITNTAGAIRYSGINWTARLDAEQSETIVEGEMCRITGVNGNVMVVVNAD